MAAIIGEVLLITTIGIHHVDFIVPAPKVPTLARSKDDALTVGRPGRIRILKRIVRDSSLITTIGIHHIDVQASTPDGIKGDVLTVGRP